MAEAGPAIGASEPAARPWPEAAFDVLVVGGGITGAATFRDLALQGASVVLIDKGRISSGASAALTRIAQGGFRYLETGEIGLVARSVTERNLFIANAPSLVRPIRVVIPTTSWLGGFVHAARRFLGGPVARGLPGYLVLRIAVALYDIIGRRTRILPKGGSFGRAELRRRYPGISGRYHGAAYVYEGAVASPEAVARDLIAEGLDAGECNAAFEDIELAAEDTAGIVVWDRSRQERRLLHPLLIVNAAGAWANDVAERLGLAVQLVRGVAGTHLFLDAPDAARALGEDLLFFEHPGDRRLCCVYVVDGLVLVGATEIAVDDPDQSTPTAAEDAYLLAAINHLLPGLAPGPQRIVSRLHGVRPLVASDGADLTGLSRDHTVHVSRTAGAIPVISIVGGKWTTFRAMAEDATDAALAALGRQRVVSTRNRAIGRLLAAQSNQP